MIISQILFDYREEYFNGIEDNLPINLNFQLNNELFNTKKYIFFIILFIILQSIWVFITNRKSKVVEKIRNTIYETLSILIFNTILFLGLSIIFALFAMYTTNLKFIYIWLRETFSVFSALNTGVLILILILRWILDKILRHEE